MADIRLVWNRELMCADWQVVTGRLTADDALDSAIILALFTDRRAREDDVLPDNTGDRRGWWGDGLSSTPMGSRLWLLERRKITNRGALEREAEQMCDEGLAPLIRQGRARAITVVASVPPAGPGSSGNRLTLSLLVELPAAPGRRLSFTIPVGG